MQAPRAKTIYPIRLDSFLGVDLRNAPSKVSTVRSPNAVNMIRDTVGTNRKRHGYETILTLDGRVNGFHTLKTPSLTAHLIHAGSNLYLYNDELEDATLIYQTANDHFSQSRQINSKLYILDGKDILVFDGTTVESISNVAYIPTTTFAKAPSGGGTSLEPLNLVSPYRTEKFTGTSGDRVYQLGASDIDNTALKVESVQADGTIVVLTEEVDYTVNRTLGTVTFTTAKPTPVPGQDNIYITYAKTITGYADRVKKCDICALYGMNGQRDRLFVSGNPEYPQYDWYCKSNDPTYFGDIWYSVLGQDNSKIMGYSILNGALITYKNGADNDSNVIIRVGTYDENTNMIVFQNTGNYEAAGALSKNAFSVVDNEPIYLTVDKNIQAITPSDVLGERSSQERSYYISSALAKEENLEEAYSIVYDDFYMLAVGEKMYILDSTQPHYEKNVPYSNRQYECYLWTDINARTLGVINDRLFFGTTDGKVKRFSNDLAGGFTDDGIITQRTVEIDGQNVTTDESFTCYWDTPEIYCGSTDHSELKKTFKYLAILLNAYAHTGCRVWAKIDGIWEVIFDYDTTADFFDWNDIDFNRFTFRTDDTPTVIGGKFKAKKLLHIQFRFENSRPQPFSILFAKIKYTVGNEYRK